MSKGPSIILRIYFAVVAAVTLFTLMYGTIDVLTIGLKTYVFTAADVPTWGLTNCEDPNAVSAIYPGTIKADGSEEDDALTPEEKKARCESANDAAMESYRRENANNAVRNLALIIVSLPLFLLHFRVVYRDWKAEHNA